MACTQLDVASDARTMKGSACMRRALVSSAGRRGVATAGGLRGSGIVAGRRVAAAAGRAATAAPRGPDAAVRTRAFSAGARRQAGEEAFDPATVERESDEVDVCIVGGGTSPPSSPIPRIASDSPEV